MNQRHVWSGNYKGISFEISKHKHGYKGSEWIWCYYICINMNQVPDEFKDEMLGELDSHKMSPTGRTHHFRRHNPVFDNCEFHCGVTYCDRIVYDNSEGIKVGCDYNHCWDEGHSNNEDFLLYDVKNTINLLIEQAPYIHLWCQDCGEYINRDEGMQPEDSEPFYCNKCLEDRAIKSMEKEAVG